eukprot:CAMPEP_0195517908 /NCGR_PEP_ID=MMETSP0794_2-20130614/11816_1 /TAXON_ID=515487 /ORGANISM="Stephanopyxis turris, Strain CCMP 815" /LENGTH=409 /DNA_ID=CAMNT_0040646785 /DNA_START=266 /DNA_END=1495 /DNA_ORIENTATION=+
MVVSSSSSYLSSSYDGRHSASTTTPVATAIFSSNKSNVASDATSNMNFIISNGHDEKEITEDQVSTLKQQGFTTGLANAISENCNVFPLRMWVVDNSGSMNTADGHRILETVNQNNMKIVNSTRWEEIKECVNYHAQMSALLNAPTVFRLLNDPGARLGGKAFCVADKGKELAQQDIANARSTMNKISPGGLTPLTEHVLEIQQIARSLAPQLRTNGQKVVIALATDGIPTDDEGYSGAFVRKQFVDALRLLEGLPVWIVIRLCTDDDEVVNFYNDIDEQLELSIEVLDDFVGEAKEVYEHNKWLNYALPLHRCREMGFHDRVFDLIDERTLTRTEVRQFCVLIFGKNMFDGVPDPEIDWMGFVNAIARMLRKEKNQWNPIEKKMMPWIDIKALNSVYGSEACMPCSIL